MDDFSRSVDMMDTETSCPFCNAEFLDSEDLSVHMKQHTKLGESNPTRFCNSCLLTFPDIEYYALHIINNHLSTAVSCKYCTRVFYDRNKMKRHEHKHNVSSLSGLSCSQCDRSFCNKMELELHEYREHPDGDDGIMLQKYFSTLSSLLNMNIRKFFAVPYENFVYKCVSCNISTHNVEKYIRHLQIENVKSFTCDCCCRVYSSKYNMVKHFQSKMCQNYLKTDTNEMCEKCNKNVNKALYKEHIKHCTGNINLKLPDLSSVTNDNAAPLQSCKYCHRPFVGSDALRKHIERTHKDSLHLYKYLCLSCDMVFKHPKILFTHYFTKHKDLKPYTCKICNEKFRIRKTFTLHIKLNHKSIGFVEFDKNYHVFFTDKKSEHPFQPQTHTEGCTVNSSTANKENSEEAQSNDIENGIEKPQSDNKIMNTENNDDKTSFLYQRNISDDSRKDNEVNEDINSSYLMQITETEGDITELDSKRKSTKRQRKKRKVYKARKPRYESTIEIYDSDPSSDNSDMPLFSLKNRVKSKHKKTTKLNVLQSYVPRKNKFYCTVCNKNCYTYQNYHYHLSLHKKYKKKKCIKCDETFKSKSALTKHIQEQHASSQLTETLKQLLERRKNNIHIPKDQRSVAEGLRRTIKKIQVEEDYVPATFTRVDDNLSVKNFLENFTPDTDSSTKDIAVNSSVIIKVTNDILMDPVIKMSKFNQESFLTKAKPKMPVKFKVDRETEKVKVTIKLAQVPLNKPLLSFTNQVSQIDHSYSDLVNGGENVTHTNNTIDNDSSFHYDNNIQYETDFHNNNDDIPEVAEEIMLNTEGDKVQQKVIIPNLPENYSNIRIAHLQSQAPFYKIVKLNEISKPKDVEKPPPVDNIVLPDGTKLVNVNPLAHLMRDMDMEEIFKGNRKNYESKPKDIKTAIIKALDAKHRVYNKKKTSKS